MKKILLLPGDGIGPEICTEAVRVLDIIKKRFALAIAYEEALIGGAAIAAMGEPFPLSTQVKTQAADAVLLAAVGGPQWDHLPTEKRPEKGLLQLRAALDTFANLRPAICYPSLADASTLKKTVVSGLDLLIVRELTGGIYFGKPRGTRDHNGETEGFNTLRYTRSQIRRVAQCAFGFAHQRRKKLCSVDKANVLESMMLWRLVVDEVATKYPDVAVQHMYVDNAAMQLVRNPKQFDVMLTSNLFGDILSDCAAMLTGSIGMLPSASLNAQQRGIYEPVHGSAPDIAGQNRANPLAIILSLALLLRYSLAAPAAARAIEIAVEQVLQAGLRTADISNHAEETVVSTTAMGDAICCSLKEVIAKGSAES